MVPPPAPGPGPAVGGPPGDGSTAVVLLVHGVGLDGELFGAVAGRLEGAGVVPAVVRRRGYDGRPPTA